MAYATIDDVFKRYSPISTMVGTGTNDVTSVDVSSVYVADAESYVNAYLGARYVLPLSSEPIVTQLTSDIAIYKMLEDRAPRIPDFMDKRFERAQKMLEMLRDGDMILTGSNQQISSGGNQEAWANNSDYHPVFSPVLDPLDQHADADFITNEKDIRSSDI